VKKAQCKGNFINNAHNSGRTTQLTEIAISCVGKSGRAFAVSTSLSPPLWKYRFRPDLIHPRLELSKPSACNYSPQIHSVLDRTHYVAARFNHATMSLTQRPPNHAQLDFRLA
jgi:hypothetical protein